jgi:uncharacterized coiled-coil DUF342 family protein
MIFVVTTINIIKMSTTKIDELAIKLKKIKRMPKPNKIEDELMEILLEKDPKAKALKVAIDAVEAQKVQVDAQMDQVTKERDAINKKHDEMYYIQSEFRSQIWSLENERHKRGQDLVKWQLERLGPDSDDDEEDE